MPVVVPLSSWAVKRLPLQDWIAEQLSQIYDIPRRLSEQWVREETILPLLDGLDEMEEAARPARIAAINTYHQARLLVPLVVCSRKVEYEAVALQQRLVLQSAVVVQPLSPEQVDNYLLQIGKPLETLRGALTRNAALRDLATTPLMLSILILTYQETAVREFSRKADWLHQEIWTDYIKRMVDRKGDNKRYPLQQTYAWLGWLARQMSEHNQTVFYLEHLQPDYLHCAQQRSYEWLAVRLPALLIGILTGITIIILFNNYIGLDPLLLQYAVIGGLLGWLFSRSPLSGALPTSPPSTRYKEYLHRLGKGVPLGIVLGLIVGLGCEVLLGNGFGSGDWLENGSIFGLVIAISCPILSMLLPSFSSDIVAATSRPTRRRPLLIQASQTIHGQRAWLVFVILGTCYGLGYGLSSQLPRLHYRGMLDYWLSNGLSTPNHKCVPLTSPLFPRVAQRDGAQPVGRSMTSVYQL